MSLVTPAAGVIISGKSDGSDGTQHLPYSAQDNAGHVGS